MLLLKKLLIITPEVIITIVIYHSIDTNIFKTYPLTCSAKVACLTFVVVMPACRIIQM